MKIYFFPFLFLLSLQTPLLALTCTFLGTTNTDWHTASNWDCGIVPNSTDDVVINMFSGAVSISSGHVGECNNFTKGGFFSSLILSNGATLKVGGTLTYNGGVFSGDVSFVGSTQQVIKGLSPLTLTNVSIANPQGVLMDGNNLKVSGTLSLQGNIYTNGKILEVSAISGYSSTVFVVTGDNLGNGASSGGLSFNLNPGSGAFYPIGSDASSYTPVSLSNTSGPAEKFTIGVLNSSFSQDAIKRNWLIEENTAGGNTASITLQWDQSLEGTSFDRSSCGVYKSAGSSIDFTGYTPQVGPASSAGGSNWAQTLSGVTEFSEWIVHNNVAVLPVTLIDFSLENTKEKELLIHWTIDAYSNPDYFELEKSTDGLQFFKLAKILADDQTTYRFSLLEPPFLQYFRLKMVDTEGKTTYSKVLAWKGETADSQPFQLFPNPLAASRDLNILSSSAGKFDFVLRDSHGRMLQTTRQVLEKGPNQLPFRLKEFPPGFYFLYVLPTDGPGYVHKLILE